ncbi:tldc domain-containing protein [Stylonychia lemnae]|uniref:Tldc domain-containing protein n=1 Tax=Stylonychia lemnae TaxID=5949 RepID=A0A078AAI7_STYLE|nr:tldc domain-containing protein [Stylonychia lemnae]|eukprot:CDW79290.1 tldc domain-containing protein [Stylonychia lemnae]
MDRRILGLKIKDSDQMFQIQGPIGGGGFGEIYEAYERDEEQKLIKSYKVAVKQQVISNFKKDDKGNGIDLENFSNEILRLIREITSLQLCHPSILDAKDAFLTEKNQFIIVSELADKNLGKFVQDRNASKQYLSVSEISSIMLQILEGLECIHENGFIHRDISHDNVLVFKNDFVKICDLGIASYGKQTQINAGKETYKAPEVKLSQLYGKNADIWSLGILLYYLITGNEDYQKKPLNNFLAVAEGQWQKVTLKDGYYEFQEIFNSMTAFKPEQRPNIQQMKDYFIRLIDEQSNYHEYQKLIMKHYFYQTKEAIKIQKSYLQKQSNFHLKNLKIRSYDAIQADIKEFLKELNQYKDILMSSYEKDLVKFCKLQSISIQQQKNELKFQPKVAQNHIPYEEKKSNFNGYQPPNIIPKTTDEIVEYKKNFRRLVDKHVNQTGNVNELVIKLKGKCNLLYRASTHGFKAENFHQKCDNQGPTVSFVLSEFGQVFGGYTSLPWKTPEGLFQEYQDGEAYIFQLSKGTIHRQSQIFGYAVSHYKNQLFSFGMLDIQIKDECNLKRICQAQIGSGYQPPKNVVFGDKTSCEYLAGGKFFSVLEIEVYSVKAD